MTVETRDKRSSVAPEVPDDAALADQLGVDAFPSSVRPAVDPTLTITPALAITPTPPNRRQRRAGLSRGRQTQRDQGWMTWAAQRETQRLAAKKAEGERQRQRRVQKEAAR